MKFTKANLAKMSAVLLCSAVLFCGCTKNSDVVIKVNDEAITRAKFYEDFNKIKNIQFKNAPKEVKKDTSAAMLSFKGRYTNDIIIKTLLNQEFAKRNIQASEEEIQAKQKEVITQIGSEEQFNNILKENHISKERLHSDMAQEVKMGKLVDSLGIKDATDKDALDFYNKNKERFMVPERAKVSHILIETDPEAIKRKITDADKSASLSTADVDKKVAEEVAKKEKLANEVLAKAKANPKDFAKLASEYSDDTASAKNGGDLGFITRESVVKEFGDAAFTQKINTVGALVKTPYGKHIIIVKDRSKAGSQPFDEIKNDLKNYLTQQIKGQKIQTFVEGLRNTANIEYVDESFNPEKIKAQFDEAIKKQIEEEQKANARNNIQPNEENSENMSKLPDKEQK